MRGYPSPAAWDRYAERMNAEMAQIDRLPRRFRLLIHEYGIEHVRPYIGTGMDPRMVRDILRSKRERRQEKVFARCA